MRHLYSLIERFATTDLSVIIEGETGTGKDVFARMVHDLSLRASPPFDVLDCTAIPDNLVESELFGHERGAFTGRGAPEGTFERAHTGAVLLDEIGEIKLDLQPAAARPRHRPDQASAVAA